MQLFHKQESWIQREKLAQEDLKQKKPFLNILLYFSNVSRYLGLCWKNFVLLKHKGSREGKVSKIQIPRLFWKSPQKVMKNPSDTTNICLWNNRKGCLLFIKIIFAIT